MSNQIGHDFMVNSVKIDWEKLPQKLGVPQPPLESLVNNNSLISLPAPQELKVPDISLRKAIEQRKTIRTYADKPISFDELSYLLWCTQGVKELNEKILIRRNVPSAGSRHAFETFLFINRVDSLKPGLYQYASLKHALIPIRLDDHLVEQAMTACKNQKHIIDSAVTFFWAAFIDRLTWRYMARGYRYVFLDAGHVCQNLYLVAEGLECGVCAIGAFEDEDLNNLLGLDGENQFVVYGATLGKKGKA